MKNTLFIFIVCLSFSNKIHSQNKYCESIPLYQIKKILFEDLTINQNVIFFNSFYEKVEFQMDTLTLNCSLDKYFIFIRIRNIEILSIDSPDFNKYIHCFKSKIHTLCDDGYYLLALDKYKAMFGEYDYLRLKQFDRLDLSFFFKALEHNQEYKLKKKHLKIYKNQLFDIYCMYQSWKKYSDDVNRYPCLKPCEMKLGEPFIVE